MKVYVDINSVFKEGDDVVLLKEEESGYCIFTIGHIFKIKKIDTEYNIF